MYFKAAFCSLIALAAAAPRPQDIDFAAVDAIPDPTYSIIPGLQSEVISYNPTAARSSAAAEITTDPLTERDLSRVKRGACDPEPTVANKYNLGSLSDPTSFAADSTISSIASQATAPSGYTQSFVNLAGSSQAYGYMGYYLLDTYSTDLCAAKCNAATGCLAFNIYFERDPTLTPDASSCPNPPAFAAIKCTLWAGNLQSDTATNTGQSRASFKVVIAGSNGYTSTKYQSIPGYTGPTVLNNGAINAPLDCNGKDTYMGFKLFTDGVFDVAKCSAACDAQSKYNLQHPPKTGGPQICRFFNTYILYKNNVAQGQYCSLYSQPWNSSYATNTGQYRGSDRYTISYSFSYYNSTDNQPPAACPADISYLQQNGQVFCTSYNMYVPPTSTFISTVNGATPVVSVSSVSTATTTTTTTAGQVQLRKRTETTISPDSELYGLFELLGNSSATLRKRSVPTPSLIASWSPSKISAACSLVAKGTVTVSTSTTITPQPTTTTFISTTTVTSTSTVGPQTYTAIIQFNRADNKQSVGYLSNGFFNNAQAKYTTDQSSAMRVWFTVPSSGTDSQAQLRMLNAQTSTYPYLGLIEGRDDPDASLGSGKYNYLYWGGVGYTTPGATPQSVGNTYSDSTETKRQAESSVWNININTGELSAVWVNPDGSTPAQTLFTQSQAIYQGGDQSAFLQRYPSPVTGLTATLIIQL